MSGVGVIAVLALGVGATFVLYGLIASETADPEIVDRETAERKARERGGRGGAAETTDRSDTERDDPDAVGWDTRDDGRWNDG
ncbi:hypothetical protein SAMN06269185_2715 [Natronoarchaeum philippinense]|uniref:Uncharacterized protein n=1 Tax=Natronoarchaeum philippinense TaxID=558529 RepID=A0A285P3Z9_NATPI|nr:hypothetical protein [Natronoarchaeum philippinense]SNZ16178.1 hypothetical protein SAMN06269185_2715 [Natronoarchaeum philippinense]